MPREPTVSVQIRDFIVIGRPIFIFSHKAVRNPLFGGDFRMFICHIGGDACPLSCIGAIPNTTSDVSATAVADGDDSFPGE